MARVRYDTLPTEQRHPRSRDLDRLSVPQLVHLMSHEDGRAVRAVTAQQRQISDAVHLITRALGSGGRLFFLGAGTSGRLGVLEAAECPPTFHTPPSLVQALIAGGRAAVFRSREGAEDNAPRGRQAVRRAVRAGDAVVGITASGVTAFVAGGLKEAAARGAHTILITCHPRSPIPAQVRIVLAVGAEVLTGSTRLKAGTATKLVLNMLTLGAMVQLGRTYGDLMVDVRPTSRKLHDRAVRTIQTFTGGGRAHAARALRASGGHVKVAILMARRKLSRTAAKRRLAATGGSLRRALQPA